MQPTPPTDTGAPVAPGPDGGDQVTISLGPDPSIYPQDLIPAAPPPAPPAEAPEPEEPAAPGVVIPDAGAESAPEGETRGTRRRAAEDAYQRGLTEGRAAIEREQAQQAQTEQAQRIQREANQRVDLLFQQARAPDLATRQRAWGEILQMYDGNRQAAQLTQTTRQQVLLEMAADFATLKNLDPTIKDEDYQQLHAAPTVVDLAKRAFDFGKRSRDEQVAKLEAEIQGLRGRLVGSRATPEPHNGPGGEGGISIEEYQAMSPKEARKLTPAQIDALTAQLASAAASNGRS